MLEITTPELMEYVGLLFGAYAIGWCSGYIMYAFKRFIDLIG